MTDEKLLLFWNDIPNDKANAVTYQDLQELWGRNDREVRKILHKLSSFDNGDDYVLIRSSKAKGFYKTDNTDEIKDYKRECLNKGKSVFAPVKKINRILSQNTNQLTFDNNLRVYRERKGLVQKQVCEFLSQYDSTVDNSLLSKFENGVCLPTPYQLALLAKFYEVSPADLIRVDLYGA